MAGPTRYRLLSEHFQACAELSERDREAYLRSPAVPDASLREDLRELLRGHAAAPPRRAKAPGFAGLLAAAGLAAAILLALRGWTLGRLEVTLREDLERRVRDLLRHRASIFEAWMERKVARVRSLLERPDAAGRAGEVDALGFLHCDASGRVLRSGTLRPAARLHGLPREEVGISAPRSGEEVGVPTGPVMLAGGPLEDGAVGVFVLDARDLYASMAIDGPAELIVFDGAGLVLNDLKCAEALRRLGRLDAGGTALRTRLRDPGRELRGGEDVDVLLEPPTRMCLAATGGTPGVDVYRNVLGRRVVGAWAWLAERELGIAVEEDLDRARAGLAPVEWSFDALGALALLLLGWTGIRLRASRRTSSFGFYVLSSRLGRGGAGEVFLARHAVLDRRCALKVLSEARPSGAELARFRREARLASRLGHPNAVQIFDYGEMADGRPYFAMEYVEGLTFAQLLILENPLPTARAIYLLKQVSGVLEEAHALGLAHRDLKPSNVMVGRKGALGDVVKVLDFGIASEVEGETEPMGTPAFMAPERIREPKRLDPRSDVYAFGALAFHLLTGRSVFEGPGPAELIYQVLTAPRPSPSKLRGGALPDALEALILSCLAISPDARPASMEEVAAALKTVQALEVWGQEEARAWWAANAVAAARLREAAA